MFMKYSIVTRIYTEILINQAVDNFTSSRFRESRNHGNGSVKADLKKHNGTVRKKSSRKEERILDMQYESLGIDTGMTGLLQ